MTPAPGSSCYSPGPLIRATLFKKGYPSDLIRGIGLGIGMGIGMEIWLEMEMKMGMEKAILMGMLMM